MPKAPTPITSRAQASVAAVTKQIAKKQARPQNGGPSGSGGQSAGKGKGKGKGKPRVSVSFEGGQPSGTSGGKKVEVNGKGKGKAVEANVLEEDGEIEVDDEEQQDKPSTTSVKSSSRSTKIISPSESSFLLVAGSYEKNLYGIQVTISSGSADDSKSGSSLTASTKPIFIFPAHISCIKACAASPSNSSFAPTITSKDGDAKPKIKSKRPDVGGKWLATGSDDEIVKIWDLRRRKEVGGLSQHVGSITDVTFPTRSHLLCTSTDSTISLFRTRDWALLRSLKGHSGRVNSVSVHPSGKVALSVGKDKTLKMWDLMRGRGASSLGLGREGEKVAWWKDGKGFGVLSDREVEIYATDMKHIATIAHTKRLHDLAFTSAPDPSGGSDLQILLTGTEDGKVLVYEMRPQFAVEEDESDSEDEENAERIAEKEGREKSMLLRGVFGGHTNRVKALATAALRLPGSTNQTQFVTTVSSDGYMNVYDLSALLASSSDASTLETPTLPIGSYNSEGSRLVCCCTAEIAQAQAMQKAVMETSVGVKIEDEDGDEDQELEYESDDMYGEQEFEEEED